MVEIYGHLCLNVICIGYLNEMTKENKFLMERFISIDQYFNKEPIVLQYSQVRIPLHDYYLITTNTFDFTISDMNNPDNNAYYNYNYNTVRDIVLEHIPRKKISPIWERLVKTIKERSNLNYKPAMINDEWWMKMGIIYLNEKRKKPQSLSS